LHKNITNNSVKSAVHYIVITVGLVQW